MKNIPPTKSLLRREEYRALTRVSLSGKVLDIGGVPSAIYHRLLKGQPEILTANIDPTLGTDYVFDAEKPWPLPSESFSGVLCMNMLEHLYNYRTAIQEAKRVLMPGAMIVGTVPFLFNVHASPNDYFRYTKSTLERLLTEEGFVEVEVTPLGTGAFSVVYHTLMRCMRWQWLASLGIAVCTGLDRFLLRIHPHNTMSVEYFPLGYMFVARAPQSE